MDYVVEMESYELTMIVIIGFIRLQQALDNGKVNVKSPLVFRLFSAHILPMSTQLGRLPP